MARQDAEGAAFVLRPDMGDAVRFTATDVGVVTVSWIMPAPAP